MLTENEQFVLDHIARWGSDGYPLRRSGTRWWVDGIRGCGQFPSPFPTKRAAAQQWEAYYRLLLDKKAGRI